MRLTILHTNDLHGMLTPDLAKTILQAREHADALYFDSGDAIKSGNLAMPLRPEPVWELFRQIGLTAATLGNRESHPLERAFRAKIAGAPAPIVCANLFDRSGELLFPSGVIIEWQGKKIGCVGAMVPIVTERMKTQSVSQYLWTAAIPSAVEAARRLRQEVDLLIALTHIGLSEDRKLAAVAPEIDVILGGHSHNVLEAPEVVNGVSICQGGSHARFFGRYAWDFDAKSLIEAELRPLRATASRNR